MCIRDSQEPAHYRTDETCCHIRFTSFPGRTCIPVTIFDKCRGTTAAFLPEEPGVLSIHDDRFHRFHIPIPACENTGNSIAAAMHMNIYFGNAIQAMSLFKDIPTPFLFVFMQITGQRTVGVVSYTHLPGRFRPRSELSPDSD